MKKIVLKAFFCLLAVSCSNESEERVINQQTLAQAPVSVRVDGFAVSQENFPGATRATAVGSYNGVKFLTLAFYANNGTEVFKQTQNRDDADTYTTFGEFSTSLPIGSYTMVVLGYRLYDDDVLTLTSPTQAEYTVGYPRDTFAATQVVNVTSTTALNLTATLNRIVACLQVVSSDGRTMNVDKVRMTFSAGGKRFSPTSGLATLNTGSVSTVSVTAAEGAPSTSSSYVFLTTDQQEMSVTIETLDSDGNTIYTKTVENVPFRRNQRTKLNGAIYGASAEAGSFQVNTEWIGTVNMNF